MKSKTKSKTEHNYFLRALQFGCDLINSYSSKSINAALAEVT